jgi:proline racemase
MKPYLSYSPPPSWQIIHTVDMHTGGEPLRIFTGGLPEIKGATILEKRRYFRDHYDALRTSTMWEPRGHADMYGAVITPPTTPDADFGVFFMHNEGYSTMCGHAIIALTKFMLESGRIRKEGDTPRLIIDAPPGRIIATAYRQGETVCRSSFLNVPSFVLLGDGKVRVDGLGEIRFDIAFGGAFYALVDAAAVPTSLEVGDHDRLIDYGRRIKQAVMNAYTVKHPYEEDLGFLYGVIFTAPPHDPSHHSRNVCIFADGELDRSATGSGVSARAALLYGKHELEPGEVITIESILDTVLEVGISDVTTYGPHQAVIPEVSGMAYFTGQHTFYFDPEDPLRKGFIFR